MNNRCAQNSENPYVKDSVALSLSAAIVDRLLAAREKGLPPQVRETARLHIADALAIGTAARPTKLAGQVIEAQLLLSGSGSCSLIGGGRASALAAAFINSSLIHILDYDDIYDVGRLHPGAVVLPAALAAAEASGASDDALIDAVALSTEVICRLGAVCAPKGEGPGSEWFLTQLFGYVAASIAAGLVLSQTASQLVSSIGLAYMQAAGGKQAGFGTGSTARAIYPAFAAQGGLQAAFLAQSGMMGPEGALDGAAGLFRLYLGDQLKPEQRTALLDFSKWYMRDVDIKPWPSCRLSHPYVAVALASRLGQPAGIPARVRVSVNSSAGRLCRPLPQRRRPLTLQDAKYSIPFMTAYALVHGDPTLDTLSDAILSDAQVLGMAARIEIEDTLPDNPGHPLAELTLISEDGTQSTFRFTPEDLQMDEESVKRKFFECMRHAGLEQRSADQSWRFVLDGNVKAAIGAVTIP